MARKSIGENNVKFQVVLPGFLDAEIDQLAQASELSKAQYIRRVLRQAVQQRAVYSQEAALILGDRRPSASRDQPSANVSPFPEREEHINAGPLAADEKTKLDPAPT